MEDLITFITPDFHIHNERGWLYQLCHEGWRQVNASFSVAGSKRGGHYHKYNREAFFIISGKIEILLEKENVKHTVIVTAGDFFVLEKNVLHTFYYPEDTLTVALYDIGVEGFDGEKDIHAE